jgi:hypothetical protein
MRNACFAVGASHHVFSVLYLPFAFSRKPQALSGFFIVLPYEDPGN